VSEKKGEGTDETSIPSLKKKVTDCRQPIILTPYTKKVLYRDKVVKQIGWGATRKKGKNRGPRFQILIESITSSFEKKREKV